MTSSWQRLDNAAKIFPSSSNKTDSHVFRFTCELYENIDPAILLHAFKSTLDIFDFYKVTLKRGFFWHYLEPTDFDATVSEEKNHLCGAMYNRHQTGPLLELTYFGRRINFEIFHVLSDGTGALSFLRVLVSKYLSEKLGIDEPAIDFDASRAQMQDDSFFKYYSGAELPSQRKTKSCQIQGPKYRENRLRGITGTMSTGTLLRLAHDHNATLTVFLSACLSLAISEVLSNQEKKKPVILCVPVNLRRFFPSQSMRNFFTTIYVPYYFSEHSATLSDVIETILAEFNDELREENVKKLLNFYSSAENHPIAKIIPLKIKDLYLGFAYRRNLQHSTATISNIGVVQMPDVFDEHIRNFEVCSGTKKLHVCLCSYLDKLSISFTSPFLSADIERIFFRILNNMGAEIEIISNDPDEYLETGDQE